ncbi:MAG: ribosome recycling factor [Xanthomonadales bacterium]|nr:ribosome recycling factor [Xanthomonadales bacterium]
MSKSVESLKTELTRLRTGRASTALLDHLRVDYYGNHVPLNQVANVAVADARTITVTPWEKKMVLAVEKAIIGSDLGLNPVTAGQLIRIVLPPLTEQRRKELAKVVHHEGEGAKVAIRNVRRDAIQHVKELLKKKLITEDEDKRAEEEIQKLTDRHVKDVDAVVKAKEDELMQL